MATKESDSRYRWAILGIAFAAHSCSSLSFQAIGPLAPLLQAEFGLAKVEVGLLSSVVFLGAAALLLVAGSLTDRFGVRTVMSLGLAVTGVSMLAMSRVESYPQAVVAMLGAGLGGGLVWPAVSKAVVDWFSARSRGTVMGIKQAGMPLGGILAGSSLPALALVLGWRAAMLVVALLILAAAGLVATMYRDARRPELPRGGKVGMLASLRQVCRERRLWVVSFIAVMYVSVQMALITYLALYLEEVVLVPLIVDGGTRIVLAGGYLALCQAGGVFGRVFWGVISDRVFAGRRMVVIAMIGAIAAPASLTLAFFGSTCPPWLLACTVFVFGLTAVGWNGLYHVVAAETAGRQYAATGIGFAMTLNQVGTICGAPLFGLIVDRTGSYQAGWLFLGCLCAIGAVVAMAASSGEKRGCTD